MGNKMGGMDAMWAQQPGNSRMGIDNWNIEWVHSPDMRGCQCYGLDWFVSCTRIML